MTDKCPKCGAELDERFDCCEVHKVTSSIAALLCEKDDTLCYLPECAEHGCMDR